MDNRYVVVGIGEILWDLLPGGKKLGGAPVNFAFHCAQLGARSYPVSCIGADELGTEISDVLSMLNIDQSFVFVDSEHATGVVRVTLDSEGEPTYDICNNVAWDYLAFPDSLATVAAKTDAVCFGSLAQRNELSRETVLQFLKSMRPDSLKIFDVNLRQNFFSKQIVEQSLELANVLKINDEELPVLAEMFSVIGSTEKQLKELRRKFSLQMIAFTRGAKGSLLIGSDESDDHSGFPTVAIDSVGSGDAFTAALCMSLLQNKPLAEINKFANRIGAFVCTQSGATPTLPEELK